MMYSDVFLVCQEIMNIGNCNQIDVFVVLYIDIFMFFGIGLFWLSYVGFMFYGQYLGFIYLFCFVKGFF